MDLYLFNDILSLILNVSYGIYFIFMIIEVILNFRLKRIFYVIYFAMALTIFYFSIILTTLQIYLGVGNIAIHVLCCILWFLCFRLNQNKIPAK